MHQMNYSEHGRCSGIRKCLSKAVDFECKKCSGSKSSTYADEEVTLDDDITEKVTKFSHLENILSSGIRVQEAVT